MTLNSDRIRKEIRGIGLTLCLVAAATVFVNVLVDLTGMKHGASIYLIPVVIAASRWGVIPAVVGAIFGVSASAFFFYEPLYTFRITNPHEVVNLSLFIFVAIVIGQLANKLSRQLDMARQREIDLRDLYAFSRRLATAFDVTDIHAAIEDHLASVMQRKVLLFAGARDVGAARRGGITVPETVRNEVVAVTDGRSNNAASTTITTDNNEVWLVRAVAPKSSEFGVIAINLGHESKEASDEMRVRVDAVLADATATLERLGVAHAISEARMRAQTDQLREALIGSVSHELRTPLASILGAASVLSSAPALANDKKLRTLVHDVRDEAERLNYDIQNLLDASRISSDSINPHMEWADPADIIEFGAGALPPPHRRPARRAELAARPAADPCRPGAGAAGAGADLRQRREILAARARRSRSRTRPRRPHDPQRQRQGRRPHGGRAGNDVGALRARRPPRRNHQRFGPRALDRQRLHRRQWRQDPRVSDGAGLGTTVAIELPVTQAAMPQLEGDIDE